jgi:hypothetical protein
VYEIDVDQPDTEDSFDGMVFLYAGPFDPKQPLLNLVAGSEVSPTRIADLLTAGAVYNAVVTSDNPKADRYRIEIFGRELGGIHESNCAAHGAVAASDASSLGMVGGRFCVSVTWKDAAGISHVANPVAFRTDNSAAFWFFSPDAWELQVKVIDACTINKRFWVMASGTTHVDYQINVEDITAQSSVQRRSYHNKLGDTRSTLDTQAFDGCPAGAAARR